MVNAAAGEKSFPGAGRVFALHGEIEKGFQSEVLFLLQSLNSPLGQWIARLLSFRLQTVGIQGRKLFVQRAR